jgi:hypothetical protein
MCTFLQIFHHALPCGGRCAPPHPPAVPVLLLSFCVWFYVQVYVPAAIPSWNMCLHEAWNNVLVFPGGLAGAQRRLVILICRDKCVPPCNMTDRLKTNYFSCVLKWLLIHALCQSQHLLVLNLIMVWECDSNLLFSGSVLSTVVTDPEFKTMRQSLKKVSRLFKQLSILIFRP